MSLNEILLEVEKLTADERRQVARVIAELDQPADEDAKRQELYRRLIAKGMLKRIPPRFDLPREFEPVPIAGKPLSETIIEERR